MTIRFKHSYFQTSELLLVPTAGSMMLSLVGSVTVVDWLSIKLLESDPVAALEKAIQ